MPIQLELRLRPTEPRLGISSLPPCLHFGPGDGGDCNTAPLTHDSLTKMGPSFSPDGSRVAYTATDAAFGWNTWIVPVLGGEPRLVLPNAAALTWIDRQHVLFSEIKRGVLMAIVTAAESRMGERDVYVPTLEEGMAHRSWLSPDGKWVLFAEMDNIGWRPCRLFPFDRSSAGQIAGPHKGRCTYAGWSPDGTWMYFSADNGGGISPLAPALSQGRSRADYVRSDPRGGDCNCSRRQVTDHVGWD